MSRHTKLTKMKPMDIFSIIIPIFFIILTFAVFRSWKFAVLEATILAIYFIYRLLFRRRYNRQLYSYLQSMTEYLDRSSRDNLTAFPMPITLLDGKGAILWYNDLFHNILEQHKVPSLFAHNISEICDNIHLEQIEKGRHIFEVCYLGKYYSVYAMHQGNEAKKESFYALYWMDDDALKRENIRLKNEKLCLCYIMIDSYDEIPSNISEIHRSNFVTRVDIKVRDMARSVDGVLKKLEVDKYVLLFERKKLPLLEKNKFSLLEEVKKITITDQVRATLSIGVSKAEGSLRDIDHAARNALDMALSRGGDQAALYNGEKYTFYGGKAQAAEKRKRVKVRIISEALAAQITASDRVVIMGHKFADMDCMGAALALAHCVNTLGVAANIVVHPKDNLVGTMIETVSQLEKYADIFVDPARAPKLITENTLLIIVDTHSVDYIESEKVYHAASRVALIDHHRKVVSGAIENTLIHFHEPNASSCCEMITELIDNLKGVTVTKTEANALMAGILLDTKNFSERTGVRTFEAAAYLKGKGADNAEVQKYFKSDIDTYKKQLEIMSEAKLHGDIMISAYDAPAFPGIKMIAGKSADEMLSLKGVNAAYVLYHEDGKIYISARAEGDKNVQTVMEALGGGGHRLAAGAQMDTDMQSALEQLLEAIEQEEKE